MSQREELRTVAWMDDGSTGTQHDGSAHRVATVETLASMPRAVTVAYTTALTPLTEAIAALASAREERDALRAALLELVKSNAAPDGGGWIVLTVHESDFATAEHLAAIAGRAGA